MTELRPGTPTEAGMLPERIERVRDLVGGWVKEGYSPAISVLVARRGVIALHEAFGVLGPDADASPLEPNSIFPVMSVSKTFTATLVMQLVEDGLIGLNRPVAEYIPEYSGEGKDEVLVHHLLTHTSGDDMEQTFATLMRWAAEKPELPACPSNQPPAVHEQLQATYATPLKRQPGELMEYGPFSYSVLGEIARRVSGRALADLAEERIFSPLGMTDSSFVVPEHQRPRIVRRAADAPLAGPGLLGPGLTARENEETPSPGAGLYSTTRDLAVFCQTFLNGGRYGSGRLLSQPGVEAMMRNQIPGTRFEFFSSAGDATMGYGWFVESHEKWRPQGSLQSLGGVNHQGVGASIVWIDPARELVGVYLEVLLRMADDFESLWNFDLFQNAVTASIAD